MKKWLNRSGYFLFWSWNIIFLALIYCGIMPLVWPDIMLELGHSVINIDIILFFAVILLLPAFASILGFWKFRRNPHALLKLLYGIELPLLLLTLFRVFLLRECTAGVIHILFIFVLSSAFLAWSLFQQKRFKNKWIILSGNSILLWCGLWIFLFLIFLIPPSAWNTVLILGDCISGFFENLMRWNFSSFPGFFDLLFIALGMLFFFYTATLFIFLPVAYVYFAFTTWRESWRVFELSPYKPASILLTVTILLANTACFWAFNNQSHAKILQQFESMHGSREEKIALLNHKEELRRGLVNIYLAPYRYMGEWEKVNVIQALYAETFNLEKASTKWIQNAFNHIARPLIYRGSGRGMDMDQKEAERLYTQFFDAPIQEAEKDAIRHAMQSTYSREQIDAGLMNIDQEIVHLSAQYININEQNEWADVEIQETYINKYSQPEEVFYHFTLPEGAVINGLWLSDTDEKKYKYRVAPRGAAQKVYKQIVQRGNDPALIEQVGPRMYRLRIFPVPGNNHRDDKINKMHMWLNIKMLRQSASGWQLPRLSEKRNVYWDKHTDYRINGNKLKKSAAWLPEKVPHMMESRPATLSARFGEYIVTATPMRNLYAQFHEYKTSHAKIAVLLELSYSMAKQREELIKLGQQLKDYEPEYSLDYFLIEPTVRKIEAIDASVVNSSMFFGSLGASDVLQEFSNSKFGQEYNHLIVLTDKSLFMEKEENDAQKYMKRPTWFLMTDGQYPRVSGDGLMKMISSIGGTIESKNNLQDVMTQIKHHRLIRDNDNLIGIDQRYVWTISHESSTIPNNFNNKFSAFAAHKFIEHLTASGSAESLDGLNKIHEIAVTNNIVTPFSSMIVLVDDVQKKMLEDAEASDDRFERQVESGKEVLSNPHSTLEVSAVPEPEEWLLLIIVIGFLTHHLYNKRNAISRHGYFRY